MMKVGKSTLGNKAGSNAHGTSRSAEQGPATILRQGFRHPRSVGGLPTNEHRRNGPPEIKERACTWDA